MKVKIFEEKSRYDLENRLNKEFEKFKNEELIDIKYDIRDVSRVSGTITYYSAMVILK